jgi:glycosyltransferase involved in cell wall biosynthesis
MRIALVSEGTYPFAMGGVSTWCDQLIRGLDQYEWEVVALIAGTEPPVLWESPPNLGPVRSIPIWTETRGRRSRHAVPDGYAALARALVRPEPADEKAAARGRLLFLAALRDLFGWAAARDGTVHLTSDAAVEVLSREWRQVHEDPLPLLDAVRWSRMLEHLLRPLFARPVEADLIHVSMNGPSMLVAMAAKWAHGTPVVLSEHGIYLRERYLLDELPDGGAALRFLRLSFFRLLAGAGYVVADALAPHSKYNRRWQARNGADPQLMTTMYNGVATESFPVAVDEPDVPTISYLGRIDPIKDLHTLLRAFGLVRRTLPTARLRVFGGAPEGQEDYLASCHTLIGDLGIADAVTLEGPTRDPVAAYHAGSVVALSSISEGFPYTVVEAMACGRPVVCTDVGGVAEAVGDAGIVVPPRDPVAFADGCLFLLEDGDERRARAAAARSRVDEWFTVARWLGAYQSLFEQVAA